MHIGTTYVIFVPPGWLLAGTVSEIRDGMVSLVDCVHLELTQSGQAHLSGISAAETAADLHAVTRQSWPLPDGTLVRQDAILIATPCRRDMRPLARQGAADAIRGAR